MTIFKHMIENLFVTATGIAALIHSTWSLGTLFAGNQPDPTINLLGFLGWIIPALLIAFALDIGQIFTSAEIRKGDKRIIKYVTFGIFAVATYYLQWLYMAHHIPMLNLENGIRKEWLPQVTLLRDMAIWIVPAFMPLSTVLYTIGQQNDDIPAGQPSQDALPLPGVDIEYPLIEAETDTEPVTPVKVMSAEIETDKSVTRPMTASKVKHCEHCGKEIKNARPNQKYCNVVCRNNAYKARNRVKSKSINNI